MSSEFDFI
jgi:hypothetical protein